MTKEQMDLAKKLMGKYQIKVTDAECSLIFLGIGYGLMETQIEEYLRLDTSDLLEKHAKMLSLILGMENSDEDSAAVYQLVDDPVEKLQYILREHFLAKEDDRKYKNVMHYIIRDSELSAAQIEQLREAVQAGMPEKDVMEMAMKRKEVMEIRRCIEFYEMMRQKEECKDKSKRSRRASR